jgi:predicted RNA-binding protein YlxR (DUF448 family)
VACRTTRAQGSLLRVARASAGTVVVGRTAPGRGAYVCRDPECIRGAVRRGGLERALRTRLTEADLARLGEQLTKERNRER